MIKFFCPDRFRLITQGSGRSLFRWLPGEERSADRGVGEGGEVAHHHVQGLDGVVGDLAGAPLQRLLQGEQGHLRKAEVISLIQCLGSGYSILGQYGSGSVF